MLLFDQTKINLLRLGRAPGAHRLGEVLERRDGGLPVDAGVRDADALLEAGGALGGDLLVALVDVGLDHDADDGGLSLAELVGDGGGHLGLVAVVLVGVAWKELVPAFERKPRPERKGGTHRESSQS